jgi:hypothetical protein
VSDLVFQTKSLQTDEVIVPVIGFTRDKKPGPFLGTAFFVEPGPRLITAWHVVKNWDGAVTIAHLKDLTKYYVAKPRVYREDHDLVVLDVEAYRPTTGIHLAEDADIRANQFVACLEYGPSRQVGAKTALSPATRLGNVTRLLSMSGELGLNNCTALELSFPILMGASGAPVVSNADFKLWGVVVANTSYHLLPAQIDTVLDEKNQILEETQFMLPQGLAVHVRHIREILSAREKPT